MKKNSIRIGVGILVFFMLLGVKKISYAAEENTQQNRYNIVFVTDESGSMNRTDPENLRYEAIRRFIGLMAQKGNYIGCVSFNGEVVAEQKVQSIEGFAQKNNFINQISSATADGFTNIGMGLKRATETLDESRNPSLPSAIILLTDGNTEMEDENRQQESLIMKADAIERARQEGYEIYTICLNIDGSADVTEMQQIASATGGECTEVVTPEDLEEVETVYYKMIFGGLDSEQGSGEITFDTEGIAVKEFEVPNVGVEEINIIFEGDFAQCQVTDPKGGIYSDADLKELSMVGKNFTLVKISDPVGGIWKATAHGKPGTKIDFKLLYNSSFYIQTLISPAEGYRIGGEVVFETQICDSKGIIEDITEYEEFIAVLHIICDEIETTYDMELGEKGFEYEYKIPDEGTYYVYITVERGEMKADSGEPYEINVNNLSPVPSSEEVTAHANLWPFIGGTASLNLEGTATDPDKEELVYTIKSTAFNEEDYTLEGNTLKVHGFSIPKGSFTIRATDPHGAFCTYDILITSTNIGLIMALAILIGTLLVVVVLAVIIYKKKFIPFMGTITVEKFDENSEECFMPISLTPGRGSVRLESFVSCTGLPTGCKFQAGGKDKNIYFVSKKPIYSDITGGTIKKLKIEGSGSEVKIYSDLNKEKGITVTFKSILFNQFW